MRRTGQASGHLKGWRWQLLLWLMVFAAIPSVSIAEAHGETLGFTHSASGWHCRSRTNECSASAEAPLEPAAIHLSAEASSPFQGQVPDYAWAQADANFWLEEGWVASREETISYQVTIDPQHLVAAVSRPGWWPEDPAGNDSAVRISALLNIVGESCHCWLSDTQLLGDEDGITTKEGRGFELTVSVEPTHPIATSRGDVYVDFYIVAMVDLETERGPITIPTAGSGIAQLSAAIEVRRELSPAA